MKKMVVTFCGVALVALSLAGFAAADRTPPGYTPQQSGLHLCLKQVRGGLWMLTAC